MSGLAVCGLVLAALVALSSGQQLCTPSQWEGYEGSSGGFLHDRRPGYIREFNKIHYDAKNKRKAMFIDYTNTGRQFKFQVLVKYDNDGNNGTAYIVNLNTNKCWIKTWKRPFREACIPEGAKHQADFYLGLKGKGGLAVSSYNFMKNRMDAEITVSKLGDNIIPVGTIVSGHFGETSFMQNSGYVDITGGIQDESVFDVPEQCEEMEAMEIEIQQYLEREPTVFSL